ncbi:hypothetical protein EGW08_003980 [Elysia chlorotica]|uniref:ZSWIM1/3 RNaseH-like domain-containing protein n=1 Tax=Elysia chlorotica TaxID=188477 RepID=A0A433U3D7_ELYCH|nr:hypothetical protein EGW08_003980 [Elysia chlorotica]
MIACFNSFPEVIFSDGTDKKNNRGYPLYQIMVQGCLGAARPVFYALIRNETIPIITGVLQAFAGFAGEEEIQKTQVVMSDKCSNEASAIKTVLPWARHFGMYILPWRKKTSL